MAKNLSESPLILIDSHVHIHSCFNLPELFDFAYTNCHAQAQKFGNNQDFVGVLLLTESSWDHWFQHLRSLADKSEQFTNGTSNTWSVHHTDEDYSVCVQSDRGTKLLVIAGRQIITQEKLEVLALMTGATFADGDTIEDTINNVQANGGIAVLPWGFGKWWGTRGEIVTKLLGSSSMNRIFLGDNSGRPRFLPYPPQFREATRRRIHILPGSDPLPFPSEGQQVCRVGFSIQALLNDRTPGANLKDLLRNPQTTIHPYFHHETLFRFFKNQLALRMTSKKQC